MGILGVGQTYITCLIGILYPTVQSLLTISKKDETRITQWLTYWIVFGIFEFVDHFAEWILCIIPFFYVLKMLAIIYLFHPSTNGATSIYNAYLREAGLKMAKGM